MIHYLEIENFKGIGARQRIDFAPLTLLFGANSAGKSTILQALLYLHELIERGSADVDRTELGGNALELGGFARMVHRHETERAIVLRAEFATPGGLERFNRDLDDFPFPNLDDEVQSAWIELTVQNRIALSFQGPMVERATIGVNGNPEPLVWLESPGAMREGEPLYCRINLGHPLVANPGRDIADAWLDLSVPEPPWHRGVDPNHPEQGPVIGLDDLLNFSDGRPLPLIAVARSRNSVMLPLDMPVHIVLDEAEGSPENWEAMLQIRAFLEMVVLGTTAQLAAFLRDAIYIGPLRTVPPRGFLYERPTSSITCWADGLAAWDRLLADRHTLVERTNEWLQRLGAGCKVVVQQLLDPVAEAEQISVGHVDKTVRRLQLDNGTGCYVVPSEVGAGLSQLIPIVVAAVEGRGGPVLIEQPEIHVHPALQVQLGDLLIEAVTQHDRRRTMLVETHSEHLILRLLRRIRETREEGFPPGHPGLRLDQLSVVYVERGGDGTKVHQLRVDDQGEFIDRWPQGFFEERAKELF